MSTTRKDRRRSYTSWSVAADEQILNILCEKLNEGNRRTIDGKIRADTWDKVIEEYNEKTGNTMTRKNVDSRMKTWRLMYKSYKKISSQSGWGWDYVNGYTDVPEEIWRDFIEKHPDCRQCKGRPCLIFEQLQIIFEYNIASGFRARQPEECAQVQEDDTHVSLNNENDILPLVFDEVADEDIRSMETHSPLTNASTVDMSKKGKRPRPHAKSQEIMSNAIQDMAGVFREYFERDDCRDTRRIEIMDGLYEVEKEKLQIMDGLYEVEKEKLQMEHAKGKKTKDAMNILFSLYELTDEEQFQATRLLQSTEMREQFLVIPDEKKVAWLRFYLH